jgi:undecaprenyl-diphosphatase
MNQSIDLLKWIALGLVQALTEFLPVSSSGHLVIAKSLLGVGEVGITMEIVTHLATVVAVIVYLRRHIGRILGAVLARAIRGKKRMTEEGLRDVRLFRLVALGTVPAALVGLALHDLVERLFADVTTTGITLVAGRPRTPHSGLGLRQAFIVGLAQAAAIVPGLSRSGLTVGTGLALGVEKREAFEFSLLLSIPAVLGAALVEALKGGIGGEVLPIAASAVTAMIGGYLAIALLFRAIVRNRFHVFAYYLIPLGVLVVLLSRLR